MAWNPTGIVIISIVLFILLNPTVENKETGKKVSTELFLIIEMFDFKLFVLHLCLRLLGYSMEHLGMLELMGLLNVQLCLEKPWITSLQVSNQQTLRKDPFRFSVPTVLSVFFFFLLPNTMFLKM